MFLKEIVRQQLRRVGADGLVCQDAECGCGLGDFMPCDEPGLECEAAFKGEDGMFYPLYVKNEMGVEWACDCGAKLEPAAPDWRWNGCAWEHWHGGQAGHFIAKKIVPQPKGAA